MHFSPLISRFRRLAFGLCSLTTFLLAAPAVFAESSKPVVLWVSSPVAPGETILIHGGDFGESPKIEISSPEKSVVLDPVVRSDTALMVPFPEEWPPCEVQVRVISEGTASAPCSVNTPDIWWVHGDWGQEASPGGWVRLFGRGIGPPGGGDREFFLTDESGRPVSGLSGQDKVNRWSQKIHLSPSLSEGVYRLGWNDSVTGKPVFTEPFKVASHADAWKTDRFDVTGFGAVPNDGKDDTDAFLKAADALRQNKGGILYVPRGRFCMTRTIVLPPHSALQGISPDLSEIYWPDTDNPPEELVRGDHSFAVENIFLTSGNHLNGIIDNLKPDEYGGPEDRPKGNITLRNVTMRLLYCDYAGIDLHKAVERLSNLHYRRAVWLHGHFVRITGCDIYAAAGGVFEFDCHWSEISDNVFSHANIIGWNGFRGSHLVFENNHFGGSNCTSFYGIPQMSRNIYWGHNYHENAFDGNNRETITGDCRNMLYLDTAKEILPDTVVLNGQWLQVANYWDWSDSVVQICDGRGVGQYRLITSIEKDKNGDLVVKLDRPWEILPDEKTVFYIGTTRSRFLCTDNEVHDSTVALQLYGSMLEAVIADNTTRHTGGYHADTMLGETSWFIQLLNNTVASGTFYRGPFNEVPATDAHIGLISNGSGHGIYRYPLIHSSLIRDCKLLGNAFLEVRGPVDGAVVENNLVRDADVGFYLSDQAANIYDHGNKFENVETERK